jgi:hypothetical protein
LPEAIAGDSADDEVDLGIKLFRMRYEALGFAAVSFIPHLASF